MIETVCYEGSGRESGTFEKMSKVVDAVLHWRQEIVERIYP